MVDNLFLVALGNTIDMGEFTKYLDTLTQVKDWFYSLPNSVFVVVQSSTQDLYKQFSEKYPKKRFFITKVVLADCEGWMPENHWDKIKAVFGQGEADGVEKNKPKTKDGE